MSKAAKAEPVEEDQAAKWVKRELLAPWVGNPRDNEKAVDPVALSIERFGFGAPIVAWKPETPMVIAGHTRLKAATKLGLAEVPVRWMSHLTEAEAKALALADNRLGELADWNFEGLQGEIQALAEQDVDLSGLGWAGNELEVLKGNLEQFLPKQKPKPPKSLESEHYIEIRCTNERLNEIQDQLLAWDGEEDIEVQIA